MKEKNLSFISWFCEQLKYHTYPCNMYIFEEGEEITSIYFNT